MSGITGTSRCSSQLIPENVVRKGSLVNRRLGDRVNANSELNLNNYRSINNDFSKMSDSKENHKLEDESGESSSSLGSTMDRNTSNQASHEDDTKEDDIVPSTSTARHVRKRKKVARKEKKVKDSTDEEEDDGSQ